MYDGFSNVSPKNSIGPLSQAGNAAIVGAIVDSNGYSEVTYLITTGVCVTAAATFSVVLEEGADAALADHATATQLLGTAALAAFTGAGNQSFKIGAVVQKRYSRLTITPSGNTGAALVSAVALLGRPTTAPTPNPPT